MEYAMPPQSGWGMGIERILALLTGQDNLRDMILFPLMKTNNNEEKSLQSTQLAVIILNTHSQLEKWQELNTVAHLSASFSARI
jgi:lysyl-tRNA synthetase class 2